MIDTDNPACLRWVAIGNGLSFDPLTACRDADSLPLLRYGQPMSGRLNDGEGREPRTMNEVATLPSSSTVITSKAGKVLCTRHFIGSKSAAELRAAGKVLGHKWDALKSFVNAALTSESANGAAVVAATVSALTSSGFIADVCDVRKLSATIKFTKPAEVKPEPVAVAGPSMADKAAALKASGKSAEEILAALLAA